MAVNQPIAGFRPWVTKNPVISSPLGIVPTNALAVTVVLLARCGHIGISQFPDERLGDFSTAETLTRVGQSRISNRLIHVLRRLSQPESLRARRE